MSTETVWDRIENSVNHCLINNIDAEYIYLSHELYRELVADISTKRLFLSSDKADTIINDAVHIYTAMGRLEVRLVVLDDFCYVGKRATYAQLENAQISQIFESEILSKEDSNAN